MRGLIAALRTRFATFGVPGEISRDGGPELSSAATADFLARIEVRRSSHVLCVFPPVKQSCRSGGQKGKAHANGQRWPHWTEQRWPPASITPGAQHVGPRLQYITSTGGIRQAHSRCFFLP